jgi:AhpD family alkylhydroperoxidase
MREKVIVAVARVNACPMCEHAHTRMALDAGVTDAELAALEGTANGAIDRRTFLALAYARERVAADFDGAPDPETSRALDAELGSQAARDIEDVARVMTVANRIANTLKGLSDRRRGRPVPGSRLVDELVINALFLPGAWLGIFVAAVRQRRSPVALWRDRFQS